MCVALMAMVATERMLELQHTSVAVVKALSRLPSAGTSQWPVSQRTELRCAGITYDRHRLRCDEDSGQDRSGQLRSSMCSR